MPVWSKSGHELAYETLEGSLMMVSYAVRGDMSTPERPRLWSTRQITKLQEGQNVDLAPDGKRFAVLLTKQPSKRVEVVGGVNLLLNFFDDLKQRIPSGGK